LRDHFLKLLLPRSWSAIVLMTLCCEIPAAAGIYVAAGPNWNNFVFESEVEEDTANHYGYGARGSFGYSIYDLVDLGLYGHYTPGRLNSASFSQEDARLWHFGVETGLRLGKAVFFGLRGGPALYRLNKENSPSEVPGQWTGQMIQASLGLIAPLSKLVSLQLSLDLGRASLAPSETPSAQSRSMSQISATMAIVYNLHQTSAVESAIFNNWIRAN
jgi:hypothetical protein